MIYSEYCISHFSLSFTLFLLHFLYLRTWKEYFVDINIEVVFAVSEEKNTIFFPKTIALLSAGSCLTLLSMIKIFLWGSCSFGSGVCPWALASSAYVTRFVSPSVIVDIVLALCCGSFCSASNIRLKGAVCALTHLIMPMWCTGWELHLAWLP